MDDIRRTELSITYEGHNANKIGNIESFSYTDESGGNSDAISLTIDNIDKRWQNGWLPKMSDKIQVQITKYKGGAAAFNCGEFVVDDFSISSKPLTCTINATSTPINDGFRVQTKSKTWQSVTAKQIATEIATAAGIQLEFDGDDSKVIEKIEQSNETDAAFLSKVAGDYSLKMKVYSSKIIIYSEDKYEDKAAVYSINPSMCSDWEYTSSVVGTYTGAVFSYTNAKKNETYTVNVGTNERLLYINETAENAADAESKALAKVNEANRGLITMKINLKEPLFVAATSNVMLVDFSGTVDGKYFVNKVDHTIDSNGYKVSLELRKIIQKIGKPGEENKDGGKKSESTTGAKGNYTVKKNDNLWNIARKFYGGKGELYKKIYDANKDLIEEVARSHGKTSSSNGHWIWEGTILNIPE